MKSKAYTAYVAEGGTLKYEDWLKTAEGQAAPLDIGVSAPGTVGMKVIVPGKLFQDSTGAYYTLERDPTDVVSGYRFYPVDAATAKRLIAQEEAGMELTIPGKPEVPPWAPGYSDISGISYGPEIGSMEAPFGRPATPATTIPPLTLTTRPDGSTGYLLPGGQWFQMTPPTKKVKPAPGGIEFKYDFYGKESIWNGETGRYEETGGYDPTKDKSQGMTEYQKKQLELTAAGQKTTSEQEATRLAYERGRDLATQAAEKERRLAELAARPINWLQYAAETKTPPVVQPWMMPLSQEQYGWKVGEPIPGVNWGTRAQTVGGEPQFFSEEERQRYANPPTTPAPPGQDWRFFAGDWRLRNKEGAMAGSETLPTTAQGMNFQNLPELLRPSAQLWGRMGPTAQQQLYGYQQAQSGISPEESEFRRQSTLPPGGRAPRWVWSR